jgi:hypothetical protein
VPIVSAPWGQCAAIPQTSLDPDPLRRRMS